MKMMRPPESAPRRVADLHVRSALLIVNPAARQAADREEAAVAAFARAGVPCDVVRTERPGHAAELAGAVLARGSGHDAVFALGGDGTTMEVVGALSGSGVPVGALPGGTGNLIARTLGIPLVVEDAVAALLDGTVALVDLGMARVESRDGADGKGGGPHSRRFAFAAGVGIDARMIEETPARLKRRLGVLAYALTAGRAILSRDRFTVRVTVDGETVTREAAAVMVVNFGAVLGDLFWFGPGIEHDDGVLDVCLFSPRTLVDAVRILWRLGHRDFRSDDCLLYRAGRSIRVETDPPRTVEADGEILGRTPFDVQVEPQAASLLVPRPGG